MNGIFLIAIFLCISGLSTAQAQPALTDNELYAAYCMGSFQNEVNEMWSGFGGQGATHSPQLTASIHKMVDPIQAKLTRFQNYLFATGALSDLRRSDQIFGIYSAEQQATSDQKMCISELSQCKVDMKLPFDKRLQQSLDCARAKPSCTRLARCSLPDNLPF